MVRLPQALSVTLHVVLGEALTAPIRQQNVGAAGGSAALLPDTEPLVAGAADLATERGGILGESSAPFGMPDTKRAWMLAADERG